MTTNKETPVQPYTHKEMAVLYNVSWKTFKKWIIPYETEIGERTAIFTASGKSSLFLNDSAFQRGEINFLLAWCGMVKFFPSTA